MKKLQMEIKQQRMLIKQMAERMPTEHAYTVMACYELCTDEYPEYEQENWKILYDILTSRTAIDFSQLKGE